MSVAASARGSSTRAKRLEFEVLISGLSARFVNIPPERLDDEIRKALNEILAFFQVDRCALIRSARDRAAWVITHVACSSDVPPVPEGVELPRSLHPWAFEKLVERNEVVAYSRLDDVPPEAAVDRVTWAEWGIRSNLIIPVVVGGSTDYVIAFNSVMQERSWPPEFIPRLRLLGGIFVSAMERRNAEQALRESEERLRLAASSAQARLWDIDLDTGVIWATEYGRAFYGLEPGEEMTLAEFLDRVHPENRQRVRDCVERAWSGEDINVEYRAEGTPGNLRWIVSRGRLAPGAPGKKPRIMGVSIDVTERKMTETRLVESQALLSALVDSTSDLIWSVDPERFGLLTFNLGLREYFRRERGIEIDVGMDPGVLLPTRESAEKWRSMYLRALAEGSFTTEYAVSAGSRKLRLNLNRLVRGDIVFGVSVFGQDITEQKAMESRLREQLEEIGRLKARLEEENIVLRDELRQEQDPGKIVGNSDPLNYVLFRVGQVAPTDATVLILGETGAGKGLVAQAVHERSRRKDRPMITVNCAALPENLIESELFGREKGAFTGAYARQAGRFEVADKGTIYLDEIGELPLPLQSKLLRAIQDGEFERLGSAKTIKVDVRVIASTSRDLKEEMRAGRFREDLYYRLNVFPITIPPLRKRAGDIPLLVRHFVEKHARKIGRRIETVPIADMKALEGYPWPGNVRELEHVVERAVILAEGPVLRLADRLEPPPPPGADDSLPKDLAAMEREHIYRVLCGTNWRIEGPTGAAAILHLHPSTLRFRMKKLGIKRS